MRNGISRTQKRTRKSEVSMESPYKEVLRWGDAVVFFVGPRSEGWTQWGAGEDHNGRVRGRDAEQRRVYFSHSTS